MLPEGFDYRERFLAADECRDMLVALRHELHWEQREIVLFGRRVMQPRLVAWYGDAQAVYRYSGDVLKPRPWHPILSELRTRLAEVCDCPFNSVLANGYRDGRDRMGWHRDNEKELGARPVIASVSLGQERVFLLRRDGEKRSQRLVLGDGSLLVMRGTSQSEYRHALPGSKKPMAWRINLTYRRILV